MKPKAFCQRINEQWVIEAIAQAESRTTGEVRVCVTQRRPKDVVAAAEKQFERLGMTATRRRNGVLLYIVPNARRFAVVGDTAIHQRCGQPFWDRVAAEIGRHFREDRFTDGIVHGVKAAGALLAEQFPLEDDNPNELPDGIERE